MTLLAAPAATDATLLQINPLSSRFDRLLPGGGVFGGPPLTSPLTVRLPDDSQLLVGGGIALAVLDRDLDGSLSENETFVDGEEEPIDGEEPVQGLAGAVSVATSPDGRHVYAVGFTDDSIAIFGRDPATGDVTFLEAFLNTETNGFALDGATAVAVSPDPGSHVYVTAGLASALTGFARDPNTGSLTVQQVLLNDDAGVEGLGGAVSLAMDPNGLDVYVAAFNDDAVSHFVRDPNTGELEFVDAVFDGEGVVDGLDGATSIVVAPDGEGVYVAGFEDDAVVAFARDPSSGVLSFLEDERDETSQLVDLDGPTSVALSPDDAFVYASSCIDNAVLAFTRDRATERLTFLQAETPDELVRPQDIAISPDGLNLYAADADGVLVFALDPNTGRIGDSARGFETPRIDDGSSTFRVPDLPVDEGTGLTVVIAAAHLDESEHPGEIEVRAVTENASPHPESVDVLEPRGCPPGEPGCSDEGPAAVPDAAAALAPTPVRERSGLPALPVVIAVFGLLPALVLLGPR